MRKYFVIIHYKSHLIIIVTIRYTYIGLMIIRKGCTSGELFQFRCPDASVQSVHEHSRHPDPDGNAITHHSIEERIKVCKGIFDQNESFPDCQFFYLCIEGKARRNGCSDGSVFDPNTLACQRFSIHSIEQDHNPINHLPGRRLWKGPVATGTTSPSLSH